MTASKQQYKSTALMSGAFTEYLVVLIFDFEEDIESDNIATNTAFVHTPTPSTL
jgi:hypothetical protein